MVSDGNYIKVEDLNIQISKPTHISEEISLDTFSLKQLRVIGFSTMNTKFCVAFTPVSGVRSLIHQFV
jgi:hypothetical protein